MLLKGSAMSEKLIIENRTELPMKEVLNYVKVVVTQGKISETSKGKQYCFVTCFSDGITVYADKNKKSDRLIVIKEENRNA